VLSWNLMHVIDENSPLHGQTPQMLEANRSAVLLTIEGVDETTAQSILARQQWSHRELRWNHRYVDLVRDGEDGISVIDYAVFHEVLALEDADTPPA
jgi:inward rectifier potassium channel